MGVDPLTGKIKWFPGRVTGVTLKGGVRVACLVDDRVQRFTIPKGDLKDCLRRRPATVTRQTETRRRSDTVTEYPRRTRRLSGVSPVTVNPLRLLQEIIDKHYFKQ